MSDAEKKRDYRWLKKESTRKLCALLVEAGEGAELEIREDEKDGLHFRVINAKGEQVGDEVNESWPCPPACRK